MTDDDPGMAPNLDEIIFGRTGLNPAESRFLDFKGTEPWPKEKLARAKLVKDIVAFANRDGGWLVFGVDDRGQHIGLSECAAKSYDSTPINQFVNKYVDPKISCTVHRLQRDGKHYVVIRIPPFPEVPHILQASYDGLWTQGDLLIRTAENACERLRSADDFRRIVDRSVQIRGDWLLEQMRGLLLGSRPEQIITPKDPWYKDFLDACSLESEGFLSQTPGTTNQLQWLVSATLENPIQSKSPNHNELREICRNNSLNRTGWPFLYCDQGVQNRSFGLVGAIDHSLGPGDWPRVDWWALEHRGAFLHVVTRGNAKGRKVISFRDLATHPTIALETVANLFLELAGPSAPVLVTVSLEKAKGAYAGRHDDSDEMVAKRSLICSDESLVWRTQETAQALKAGLVDLSADVYETFRPCFGPLTQQSREETVKMVRGVLERQY